MKAVDPGRRNHASVAAQQKNTFLVFPFVLPGVCEKHVLFVGNESDRCSGIRIFGIFGRIEPQPVRAPLFSVYLIKKIVNVKGYVNSAPDFHDQPKVVNGASELLLEIFGEQGKHARCALGTSNLPGNIPVEVEMIVEV